MYIVLEGIIKAGKTTQTKLLCEFLRTTFPQITIIVTREPGGTEICDAIRKVVQGTKFSEPMDPVCEAFLYAASRAHSLRNVVRPHNDAGHIVIADRSFITSLAYQGCARGLGFEKVLEINRPAVENNLPDLVLFLDVAVETALKRVDDIEGDRWEAYGADFFTKVREGYLESSNLPELRHIWRNIDANKSIPEIADQIRESVTTQLYA